jgi:hypothetical protein
MAQNYQLGIAVGIHGNMTARKGLRTYYLCSSSVLAEQGGRDFLLPNTASGDDPGTAL